MEELKFKYENKLTLKESFAHIINKQPSNMTVNQIVDTIQNLIIYSEIKKKRIENKFLNPKLMTLERQCALVIIECSHADFDKLPLPKLIRERLYFFCIENTEWYDLNYKICKLI